MNEHTEVNELLPVYAAGRLDEAGRHAVERHLATCAECRNDLALWRTVSEEVITIDRVQVAPPELAGRALAQIRATRRPSILHRAIQLLTAQAQLMRRELWPASLSVILLGYITAAIAGDGIFLRFLAPLVTAVSLALVYDPEQDPGAELVLATPTSPRQLLLARLTLVFGYNLLLAVTASAGLLPMLPSEALDGLILEWLGPMAFLSAAALVFSLWIGANNAISLVCGAWLIRFLTESSPAASSGLLVGVQGVLNAYQRFWDRPLILLVLSIGLFILAFWLAGQPERSLSRAA